MISNSGKILLVKVGTSRCYSIHPAHAAGFGIGTATAWRYVTETVALLAARARKLRQAVRDAQKAGYPYAVLDGTLIGTDRVAADRPFFSGKHHCHRMNLQVVSGPAGQLRWVSGGPCPALGSAPVQHGTGPISVAVLVPLTNAISSRD